MDVTSGVPPNWDLKDDPDFSLSPKDTDDSVEAIRRDVYHREFFATDDTCEVHVSWGGLVQQWRVYSIRDGRQGQDMLFDRECYGEALQEALDRMWAHHEHGTLSLR